VGSRQRENCVTDTDKSRSAAPPHPTLFELFTGFFYIAINGFGGVLPWARWMLVEKRGWLTPDEFLETLSMCQFIPGPNIVNMATAVGARFHGPLGALVCVAGILLAPMAIVIGVYTLLVQFANAPQVLGALRGMSAVAAGLVITMAAKTALPLIKRRDIRSLTCTVLAVAVVGVLRVPMLLALAMLIPIGIAAQWPWWKPDPAKIDRA
jgi:chromate transporter